MAEERDTVRWDWLLWPVAIILFALASGLAWIWTRELPQRQDHVVPSLLFVTAAGGLLFLWFEVWLLWVSRLARRTRFGLAVAAAGLLVLAALSFRVAGFSGDVVPQLAWRWAEGESGPEAPGLVGVPATALFRSSPWDFPQFLGPGRDGRISGLHLARDWSTPPREIWRRAVGAGWSGFAVAGDFAVTQEQWGEEESVRCYQLRTGRLVWSHTRRARFEDPIGGPGPRATPSISDGRVFALGATGILSALDLVTGQPVWSRSILEDARAATPTYGVAASPLVLGDSVVVLAGGTDGRSVLAYDRESGELVWSGGSDPAAYSSPLSAVIAGVPQILVLNAARLVAHDPTTGEILWAREWPADTENISQPVVLPGARVFLSTAYGVGGKMFQVRREGQRLTVDLVWEALSLKAKLSNVVYHDGFLYGLDDGILACVDARDGALRWKGGRYGHGQLLLVEGLLLVLGEKGSVSLVEAVPAAHRELATFSAIEGKTWNHPALAGRYFLVRNDREAACFELPLEESSPHAGRPGGGTGGT